MAFLSGWGYRKQFLASRPAGVVTDYPVRISVGESSGSIGADVHCEGNCNADFSDLRFTAVDGETLLDYYIDEISGVTPNQVASVWVKLDQVETTDTEFFLYYGNAGASSESDGPATFTYFESFESLTLGALNGQDGWSGITAFEVQGSVAADGAQAVVATGANGNIERTVPGISGFNLFAQIRMRGAAVAVAFPLQLYLYEGVSAAITGVSLSGVNISHLRTGPAWDSLQAFSSDTWYKLRVALKSASAHRVWINDVEQSLASDGNYYSVSSAVDRVRIEQLSTPADNYYVDQLIIGQYLDDGPEVSEWGNEEADVLLVSLGAAGLVVRAYDIATSITPPSNYIAAVFSASKPTAQFSLGGT